LDSFLSRVYSGFTGGILPYVVALFFAVIFESMQLRKEQKATVRTMQCSLSVPDMVRTTDD